MTSPSSRDSCLNEDEDVIRQNRAGGNKQPTNEQRVQPHTEEEFI